MSNCAALGYILYVVQYGFGTRETEYTNVESVTMNETHDWKELQISQLNTLNYIGKG